MQSENNALIIASNPKNEVKQHRTCPVLENVTKLEGAVGPNVNAI